jgi:hypothetical protein
MQSRLPLVLALAACLFPVCSRAELSLSPSGVGGAIFVPYYSVEDDQASLITVTNHGDAPVGARINLTESQNGQEVLYFQLFLPAQSSWQGAVTRTETGALLSWEPGVCTVPSPSSRSVELRTFAYASTFPDGGPTGAERTRSGAIEVIEHGVLSGQLADVTNALDCDAVGRFFANPPVLSPVGMIAPPSDSLSASVQVIDVAQGVVFPVPGIALKGYRDQPIVDPFAPGPIERFSRPLLPQGATRFIAITPAGRLAFAADRGADAVSSLFMVESLSGEFHQQAELNADTQWVLSFPTKHEYVAEFGGTLLSQTESSGALAPFSERFAAGGACETVSSLANGFDGVSRQVTSERELCFEQTVLDFEGNDSGIAELRFDDVGSRSITATRLSDDATVTLSGLPVVGMRLSRFQNGALAGGVLANYTVALPLAGESSSAVAADE